MLEKKKLEKLREKRKFILGRLKELSLLPTDLKSMTDEQQILFNRIYEFDFEPWEKIKQEKGWGLPKQSADEKAMSTKRQNTRAYLREKGYLPPFGSELTNEQQEIINQIDLNDFSFKDKIIKEEFEKRKTENLLKYYERKIEAPTNNPNIIEYTDPDSGKTIMVNTQGTSSPKHVFSRLRMTEILPPLNSPLTEEHHKIIDDVNRNWMGKTKNYYIEKYLHLTTPEGRILLRTYKKHQLEGFNFNLTINDIIIPDICPYLNVKLLTDPKDKDHPHYFSIDRIDNSKGYVKGNVQIISMKANKMKTKTTELELLKFAVNGLKLLENAV